MKTWVKILLFCIGCLLLISADRVTKQLAKEHLMFSQPRSYFHDTFRFEYAENTGAALSFGDELPKTASFWLLSMVPLVVLAVFFGYVMKHLNRFGNFKLFCFALIIAGGVGNVIDRIIYDRRVTDFMNMGIGDLRTGIFNVADVCITAGVIGLFIAYTSKNKGLIRPDNVEDAL
ncbi:signal peptidase II [Mucilaginibacter sp. UR6-11]|uniref:signal peptidase II n=1 Tax=Mucilaginibacter sp. UR6-11 TaxID=1435644 RepID=UPI001E28C8A6|nr:signal peptidase II [Mucilaginibacter sp. UR6-11]MCC8425332.1 signal peptidase II [Mucilaginibacter sp. UR6-11]